MKLLDLTLSSPAANVACDEALLDWCEAGQCEGLLRFWESADYFVALGYANKASSEVDLEACRERGVPVLRRCSGGGTVLQGPGCLNYSLLLKIDGPLQSITETNCYVMQRNRDALQPLVKQKIEIRGTTDLTIGDLKFSGNAQRRRRNFLLFHGSFLLEFDLQLMAQLLKFPSRQPDYRANRPHTEFLTQLTVPQNKIKGALQKEWNANESLQTFPQSLVENLIQHRYSKHDWNFKW